MKLRAHLMGYSIKKFIPPKPDSLEYEALYENFIIYVDELLQYEGIKNEETRDYYIQKLNAVNEVLKNNSKSEGACAIINDQLLSKTDQDLKNQLITKEDYKFLHCYTIYIKEEIEKEFGNCN